MRPSIVWFSLLCPVLGACAGAYELPCPEPAPTEFGALDPGSPGVRVTFEIPGTTRHLPSLAVWLEDAQTGARRTAFVTCKAGHDAWEGGAARPEALPVWFGVRDEAGDWDSEVDVRTAATPGPGSFSVSVPVPEDMRERPLRVVLEANASFDFTAAYPESAGSNGYPSQVWAAEVDLRAPGGGPLTRIGVGDPVGADASIDPLPDDEPPEELVRAPQVSVAG